MKIAQVATTSYLKKAIRYFKKNGFREAFYASLERLKAGNGFYEPVLLSEEELKIQRETEFQHPQFFSILVPAYETNPIHLRELVQSVEDQTYQNYELIIADASNGLAVKEVIDEIKAQRKNQGISENQLQYYKLKSNGGISENTNQALTFASGDYVCLLDHDDLLTPDALFEMQFAIEQGIQAGKKLTLLYSDEDKCDGQGKQFFEPHVKEKFNLDLILSNNYICHFLVMKTEVIKELGFRKEFDGAQDYDLILRYVANIFQEELGTLTIDEKTMGLSVNVNQVFENKITHVTKILYHWRCHSGSTAENPESKMYAYEAGRRALADYLSVRNILASVEHLKHLGFYRIKYVDDIFSQRIEIGAIAGKILKGGRIAGGAYREDGQILYEGLPGNFSGPMHKAVLTQNVAGADVRKLQLRPELQPLFEEYQETGKDSKQLCEKIKELGYLILWDPQWK